MTSQTQATSTAVIRVVVVDDNFVTRAGLRSALELESDIEVVAEGQNGLDAVRLASQWQPDVILMDFRMPRLDGIQATRQILATHPQQRILMLTLDEDPQTLVGAILAGAKGYLVHNRFSLSDLVAAVRAVHDGGALITPSLAPVLLDLVKSQAGERPPATAILTNRAETDPAQLPLERLLTRRERSILELVQHGKSNREIAEALTIEEKTVKNHINSIYSKLHLRNRYEAITLRTPL